MSKGVSLKLKLIVGLLLLFVLILAWFAFTKPPVARETVKIDIPAQDLISSVTVN